MEVTRFLEEIIRKKLESNKAIILIGARQVGKTSLLKKMFLNKKGILWLNGDEIDVQSIFTNISSARLKSIIGKNKIVIIDEAQRIKDIGLRLKLITDQIPNVKLLVTGSSSLELSNKVNEPLTGRKWEYKMYPISFMEMVQNHGLLEEKRLLPHRLVYGYFPEVVTQIGSEKETLKQLADSFLFKDILSIDQVKRPEALVKLLQALAYQVGSQVSFNELSKLCGIDTKTIEKYINLLEQTFVIFRLGSFNRNLRTELKKSRKIYFYDNGIRNALIANFSQIENRTDIGALWENFLVSERVKSLAYQSKWVNHWFWRNKEQQEIDYLEEYDGKMFAYEFKWNARAKTSFPKIFQNTYLNTQYHIVHQDNFDLFLDITI